MKKKTNKTDKPEKNNETDEYRDVTVADMNVEGMRWYKSKEERERGEEIDSLKLTKGEKCAMIKAAFAAMLPMFLVGLAVFCAAFGLLVLYMHFHV